MQGVHFQVFLFLVLGFGSQRVVEYGQAQLEDFHFVHRVEMDQDGAYFLLWTPRKHDVVFEVQVMTKGYVGLGFSTNGGMKGGDMFIGWIEDDGSVEHSDRYGISNFNTPRLDPSQDFEVMGGYANDTHTVIRFSRYWVTCDKEHDFPITEDTTRVIWSYHSERRLEHHDNRGVRSLYLKETKEMKPNALVDASYEWDLRSPSVEIPASRYTLYWCTLFKVPKFTRQHQMIGYTPLIDEANLANVHHIIIYECSLNNSEHHFDKWIGQKGAQCYAPSMPMSWLACSVPILAWGIGASGEMMPDNVGIPVGEEYGGGNYFLLEVHYDNPTNKEGIVDNSGLRVFLTDQPREYEGSVLVLGAITTPLYMIPPGIDWSITTHCTTECTKETIPEGGIKVYSTNLHGHLIATSLKVRHIRDGVELEPFVEDDNYDSNFQQTRIFTNEKTVLPGDTFLTSCGYKKNDYNSTTFGGLATHEEMCLVFLHYYPKMPLAECYGKPNLNTVLQAAKVDQLENPDSKVLSAFERFDKTLLSEERDMKMLQAMDKAPSTGARSFELELSRVQLGRIKIAEPENLKGVSLYEHLVRPEIWEDESTLEDMRVALNMARSSTICLDNGRVPIPNTPTEADFPDFIPYEEKPLDCGENSKPPI